MTTVNNTNILLKQVLREVREVHALVEPIYKAVHTSVKKKKLPTGLQQALREVDQGKLIGPFHSVEAFMADLK